MRRTLSLLLPALAALILSAGASAANQSDVALLQMTAARYRMARTFLLEGDIRVEVLSPAQPQSTDAAFRIALGGSGRIREELDHPKMGVTRVCDGAQTWIYHPSTNQYTQVSEPGAPELDAIQAAGGLTGTVLSMLRGMADGVDSVVARPDDSIPYGGKDRPCAVLEVRYTPVPGAARFLSLPRTYWIDRERGLVLQHRILTPMNTGGVAASQTETFRYRRVALDTLLEAGLFSFKPPPGAQETKPSAGASGVEDLSGQTAFDFTLDDLSGKKHSLKALRGKVVMLDFWASWCGPCRRQMPLVDKLGQEFKDKGLVVFAVNEGESAETAKRYLERNNYATTALLDSKLDVGRQYKAVGIPTLVIIDRKGKIAAHYVGLRPEGVLRDALQKAGL